MSGGFAPSSCLRSWRGPQATLSIVVNTLPASPLLERQYKLANAAKATGLENVGDRRFEEGKSATENADRYVFVTVFFAVVLFLAGISLRFAWLPIRIAILAIGLALLAYGAIRLGSSPTL